MSLGMELRLRQHLAVTPQLQQALRLLQLSSLEFAEEVQQALARNPFLEEPGDAVIPPPAAGSSKAETPDEAPDETPTTAPQEKAEADDGGEGSDWTSAPAAGGDEDGDWTSWSEAPVSMHDELRRQLLLFPLSPRDRALTGLIIDELTDAGYFESSVEELAALISPEYDVEPQEVLAALRLVQHLEPVGIGARSLQECLQLQLLALPEETPGRPVALKVVGEHIALLARRDFPGLQRLIGCDETELHSARVLIRKLNPRPGGCFGNNDVRYVIPDILVSRQRGNWICTVNPAVQPRLRINQYYAEMAARRGGCDPSFAGQLQEARWFLRNIEQRFTTMLRVATAIVARQRAFLNYGEAAMKPLILKDIASELALHESTVCRVTNGKYMATPRGLFEFKYFFSRQLVMDDGGACSALAIRALMKELIAAEPLGDPLSDAQLTRLLADQGLKLARRTVTKYRTLMHIASVELRRAGAGTAIATQ